MSVSVSASASSSAGGGGYVGNRYNQPIAKPISASEAIKKMRKRRANCEIAPENTWKPSPG
jgi:hypothetical protein